SIEESNEVIEEISQIKSPFGIESTDNDHIHWIGDEIDKLYLDKVKNISIHKDPKAIKVVYSPLHGTGGTVIPKLLEDSGYEVLTDRKSTRLNSSHVK